MRHYLLLFTFLTLSLISKIQAQDIILTMSGDEVKAKVTEVTLNAVIYQNPDSLESSSITLPKSEVFMIKYANGAKEVIKPFNPADSAGIITRTPQQMYEQGRLDARKYYKGRGVFWGSAAAGFGTFLTGGISLAVPAAVAVMPPRTRKMDIPDLKLMQNQAYMQGYQRQAHKRKIGKALAGTGTGILAGTVTIVALAFAVMASQ